jgi:hypothetical protein
MIGKSVQAAHMKNMPSSNEVERGGAAEAVMILVCSRQVRLCL